MIKANFKTYASYVTDSLYQWDLNQVLSVSGLNLAVAPEVHFSNASMDRAIVRQATMTDHVVSVAIPNSLLQDPFRIYAHIGIYEGDTFKVVELVEIPVIARKRPSDYQIEDADEEIYSFKALENRIANIVANGSNARNNELVDVRIGYDETRYKSAGEAVRKQIGKLAEDIDTLNNGGLVMKDRVIGDHVIAWLDNHPEATTTVQDGSLTESKFISDIVNKLNFKETGGDVIYGEELVSENEWTTTGWTGNLTSGFIHTVGSSDPLIFGNIFGANKLYKVEFDVESTYPAGTPNESVAFTVTLGNSERFVTYKGGGSDHYCYSIKAVSDGDFRIIPTAIADPFTDDSVFSGTVKNISIKEIVSSATASNVLKDSDGNSAVDMRVDSADRRNTFFGKGAGLNNFYGYENTAIGADAMKDNGSGFWNVAIGADALKHNTVGSRNVAIGFLALERNTTGDRNYAIGTFALERNTSGRFNVAIGADALWDIADGIGNIAISSACLSNLNDGDHNISIGLGSGGFKTGSFNVSIGRMALGSSPTSENCIAIGLQALYNNEATNNIAVGNVTLTNNKTGYNNVALGSYAMTKNTEASECVALGHYAGGHLTSGTGGVFVGAFSGQKVTGANNICIGYYAGSDVTSGYGNILIGRRVMPSSPTAANELNIGDVIYADISTNKRKVGIRKQTQLAGYFNIGAGDGTTPQMVMDNGSLAANPVPGAIEYDGDDLYLTIGNGTRYKLTKEAV